MQERLILVATLPLDADRAILINRVRTSDSIAPWTDGAGAMVGSLAQRGAL